MTVVESFGALRASLVFQVGFPGGSCIAGYLGLIPELGRSLGEGNSYPLQYSGLENSMDRGSWQATVHGVTNSWTRLNDFHFHFGASHK